ncbi:hypothetical protein ULF88_09695 [Halopseudomonas pachastrellae]|nr:hypothetical protein [Halopseudomonas pachastrellae]
MQAVGKQAAVGQLGQGIVVGQVLQLFFGLPVGGQVGEEADVVRQLSTGAAHDRQLQPDGEQLSVAAAGGQSFRLASGPGC